MKQPDPVIKVTLRFGQKDADLKLLASRDDFRAIIVHALKKHLRKARRVLPLPQQAPSYGLSNYYTFRFAQSEDKDIFDLLQAIPSGYRSIAIKRLIRHAMAQCDLRDLCPYPELVMPRKPHERKRSRTQSQQSTPTPKSIPIMATEPAQGPKPETSPKPTPMPYPKSQPQLQPKPTVPFAPNLSVDDEDVFSGI